MAPEVVDRHPTPGKRRGETGQARPNLFAPSFGQRRCPLAGAALRNWTVDPVERCIDGSLVSGTFPITGLQTTARAVINGTFLITEAKTAGHGAGDAWHDDKSHAFCSFALSGRRAAGPRTVRVPSKRAWMSPGNRTVNRVSPIQDFSSLIR